VAPVLVEDEPFVLLPPAVPEAELPAAEADPETEAVVGTTELETLGMGTTREALMQLLSWLFWMLTEPDWASAPVLSRRLKKIPTPSETLTFHVKLVVFSGEKLTRALALGWPAGSTLKKYTGVPPVQLSMTGWH